MHKVYTKVLVVCELYGLLHWCTYILLASEMFFSKSTIFAIIKTCMPSTFCCPTCIEGNFKMVPTSDGVHYDLCSVLSSQDYINKNVLACNNEKRELLGIAKLWRNNG